MSCCNQERTYVYVILEHPKPSQARSASEMVNRESARIVVDRTTKRAKSPEDVKQVALYELAQSDEGKNLDPTRLEVEVTPFCG